ncbi:MAG: hypothetical protein EB107_15285, partial [Proteobacteria bacterium]|nr:hypothetical protein [Pseudomonadota bacterium]
YCMQEVRRLVASGAIGTPHYVSIDSQGQGWHRGTDATWRTYAGVHGAGQLGEMGSHLYDSINFTVGPAAGFIKEVSAVTYTVPRTVTGPDGHPVAVETLDLASALVRTTGGLQGQMITSRASASANPTGMGGLVVTGTEGALFTNFTRGDNEILRLQKPGGPTTTPPTPPSGRAGGALMTRLFTIVRFVLAGGGSLVGDLVAQAVLLEVLGVDAWLAIPVAYEISLIGHFFLNDRWVFTRAHGLRQQYAWQRFLTFQIAALVPQFITNGIAVGLVSGPWASVFDDWWGPYVAKILGTGAGFAWNVAVSFGWIWRAAPATPDHKA